MRDRAWSIALGAIGVPAGAVILAFAATSAPGCYTHQCDPSFYEIFDGGIEIPLSDGTIVWKSSPDMGPWLDFPGQRTYRLHFPQLAQFPLTETAYVAADAQTPGANFTPVSGVLGEFTQTAEGGTSSIDVFNASCADYGLQVVIWGIPVGAALVADAAVVADSGGVSDAGAGE